MTRLQVEGRMARFEICGTNGKVMLVMFEETPRKSLISRSSAPFNPPRRVPKTIFGGWQGPMEPPMERI